jgi:hypothetical protein
MDTMLKTAPEGMRGFDANTPISTTTAKLFRAAGYNFAVRYVRRTTHHDYDLTEAEAERILAAGLGLMIVQHVAPDGWHPTAELGRTYGETAALEARAVGYPTGGIIWCDLEGVARGTPAADVIGFCNFWFAAVREAGYDPGLYVGYAAGLTAEQLYHALAFRRYWSAYNLDRDLYPAVRGVQMRQGPYPRGGLAGIPFEFDTNVILSDAMGDRPLLWAAADVLEIPKPHIPAHAAEPLTPVIDVPVPVIPAPPPRDWSDPEPSPSLWERLAHPFRSFHPMRTILSRIAAAIVAVFLTFVAGTLGVEVSPAVHDSLVEGVTLLGLGIWGVLYALLHRLIDRRINPTDAARHPATT